MPLIAAARGTRICPARSQRGTPVLGGAFVLTGLAWQPGVGAVSIAVKTSRDSCRQSIVLLVGAEECRAGDALQRGRACMGLPMVGQARRYGPTACATHRYKRHLTSAPAGNRAGQDATAWLGGSG